MSDPLRPSISRLSQPAPSGLLGEIQSEVPLEATPLLRFVLEHIRLLIVGVVVLVLAFGALGVWHWHSERTEREAQLALGRILVITDNAQRLSKLEAFAKEAPESMRLGVTLEVALAALSVDDLEKAAALYGTVYSQDSKGALGMLAGFNQADVLQRLGKPAEALKVLDTLEKVVPANMIQGVREAQAACAEESGDLAKALAGYEAIVSDAGGEDMSFYQAKIAALKAELAKKS